MTQLFARESNKRPPAFRSRYPSSGRVDARVDVRMAFAFSQIGQTAQSAFLEDIFHKVVQERLSLGGYVEWNDHDVASISWDLRNRFGRLCRRLRRRLRRRACGDSVGVEPEALKWVPKDARVQMVQGYVRASGVHALDGEFSREKR